MKSTHIIQGLLTLVSQTHISSPIEGARLDRTGGLMHRTDRGRAVIQTVARPLFVGGLYRGDMPVIPANTVRGRLRRIAAKAWLTQIGKPVPETVAHAILSGAALTQGSATTQMRELLLAAAEHPFAGMFGGGPNRLPSAYTIADLVPVTGATIESGLVPSLYADAVATRNGKSGGKMLEPWELISYDHTNRGSSTEDAGVPIEDANGKRVDALYSWQTIPAGVSLFFRITTSPMAADDARLALLAESLRRFGADGIVGGRKAAGYGRFMFQRVSWSEAHWVERKLLGTTDLFATPAADDFLPPTLSFAATPATKKLVKSLEARMASVAKHATDEAGAILRLYPPASKRGTVEED